MLQNSQEIPIANREAMRQWSQRSKTTLKEPLPVETRGLAVAPSAIEKFITSSFVYISRCGVNKETGERRRVEPGFLKILREIIIDSRLQSSGARRRAPIIRRVGDDGFAFLMLIPESI